MNKQELLEKIKALKPDEQCLHEYQPEEWEAFQDGFDDGKCYVELIIEQLDEPVRPPEPKPLEPEKPKVPQVAVEFYERYKDDNLALGEWFGDFYSHEAIEEFPRMDELTKWLHDNNDETNRQREFALATLVTLGIDAVEVEKEKLYTVEIPNPNGFIRLVLCKDCDGKLFVATFSGGDCWETFGKCKLTESEIKKDFEWAWQFAKEVEND